MEPLGATALAPFAESPDEGLRRIFGFDQFREGQREVVERLTEGTDALVVMPTGSGKSLCYQLTGALTEGVTLVVSPLIALMKDQVDALRRTGLPATEINSSMSREEQQKRIRGMRSGDYKVVYVAPERFRSDSFCRALEDVEIGLLAIDEAHCISQWGHDFRPDYRRLEEVRREFGEPQTVALTATATEFVQQDIVDQLAMPEAEIVVSGFERPNLYFEVFQARGKQDKLDRLEALVDYHDGESVIVYGTTRKQVREVARALEARGVDSAHYHGGMADDERAALQDRWMAGELPVLAATNAFGMGVDKPDVRAVVHYNMPGSVEAYYQEAGRAGRDGEEAHCVLMFNYADKGIHEWFADNSYPARPEIETVWRYVRDRGTGRLELDVTELAENIGDRTDVHSMAAESALRQLEGAGHLRTRPDGIDVVDDVAPFELQVDFERIDRRRRVAHEQIDNVVDYATTDGCCQAALLEHFGSEPSFGATCGHCSNCSPPPAYAEAQAESLSRTIVTSDDTETVLRKVLSGVARAKGRRGATAVAGMLVGSTAKAVREAGFDELSTYGTLREIRKKDAVHLVDLLARHGLIRRNEYGCVLLTDLGADVMRGEDPPEALASVLDRSIRAPSETTGARSGSGRSYAGSGETYDRTLELLREGLAPDDIAERRDLRERTIRDHLLTLAARGDELNLEVEEDRMDRIREVAAGWEPGDKLRPLKEELDWSYPDLKWYLAALLERRRRSNDGADQ